ncbi:MAG: fibrobacter succinogenes major paralogous domain-containing protein [Paludibacter sp.]
MSKIKYVPITVQTSTATALSTTATISIVLSAAQNRTITRGICWSTQPNPTTANSCKSEKGGIGNFTLSIDGLQPDTKYYCRVYATTNEGTVYGDENNFTTKTITIPTLTTNAVSNITSTTATCGGNITYDGGVMVTARGVCWGTTSNPTIANSFTTDGTGSGKFISSISGLTVGTTYYVRTYATNSVGTAYGNQLSFIAGGLYDIDGNLYHTVTIGTQTWMVENLKTTTYNDGTSIPNVTDPTAWSALATPAYCWYNNDAATYKNTYGALYNWYTVNTGKLAPTGWHVPTDAEWTILENYVSAHLGASGSVAKALAATTNWTSSTTTGAPGNILTINNSSGFTALPGGYRSNYGLGDAGNFGYWWSSTEYSAGNAWVRYLYDGSGYLGRYYGSKYNGFSVRCVRDN